tara:strand:+ start:447 stop:719 length:273 start_codon:yes stop_codon:yes gene_type:complete
MNDDDYTFTLDNSDAGSVTYSVSDTYNTSMSISGMDVDNITIDTSSWEDRFDNYEMIDLDLLEKYPTAKSLYKQFINVYNMCKVNEEMEE